MVDALGHDRPPPAPGQAVLRRVNGVALPLARVVADVERHRRRVRRDVTAVDVVVDAELRQHVVVERGVDAAPVAPREIGVVDSGARDGTCSGELAPLA